MNFSNFKDDIVYRVQRTQPLEIKKWDRSTNSYISTSEFAQWYNLPNSTGGETCTYYSLDTAKRSMNGNGIRHYTIYKMYLGTDPTKYFPPEKVFEK